VWPTIAENPDSTPAISDSTPHRAKATLQTIICDDSIGLEISQMHLQKRQTSVEVSAFIPS